MELEPGRWYEVAWHDDVTGAEEMAPGFEMTGNR